MALQRPSASGTPPTGTTDLRFDPDPGGMKMTIKLTKPTDSRQSATAGTVISRSDAADMVRAICWAAGLEHPWHR